MYNLKIITASTRPGRKGPALANWIFDMAKKPVSQSRTFSARPCTGCYNF